MPIEPSDLQNAIVDGLPLGVYLTKTRVDMLTNHLLPEGCKDRKDFERDWADFFAAITEKIEAQRMKAQLSGHLAVPDAPPSGLIVP